MDESARFQELVDAHYRDLWSYAMYCAGGSSEVEDLVHEAFLAAFDRLRAGREFEGDPGAWLRAVVRNKSHGRVRQRKVLFAPEIEGFLPAATEEEQPLERLVQTEAHSALSGCVDHLPESEQDLLSERYGPTGEDPASMAVREDMNPKTLRVRLFRIRQKLKDCLEDKLGEWCNS